MFFVTYDRHRHRTRNRRDQHGRSERWERKDSKRCWNATTSFRSLPITKKHCVRMLPWRSALWRLSTTIPMNASICTARQLTPKTIFSKPKSTHESGYSSEDSIEDSLTIGLFYIQYRCYVSSLSSLSSSSAINTVVIFFCYCTYETTLSVPIFLFLFFPSLACRLSKAVICWKRNDPYSKITPPTVYVW